MSNPDFDPFKDPETSNWVSVTFPAHGGYDAPKVTVHGSAEYLAGLMNIEGFDGKLSTLMQRVVLIDGKFKEWVGTPSGKA